ncbi:apovitellenin-1-like isoform X1 [Serinus canaria]|nr:apovitellenin-1-like isoform X1 [Serinus canaria]
MPGSQMSTYLSLRKRESRTGFISLKTTQTLYADSCRSLCVESRTGTQTMLQSRALVIALILLLSTTLPEVQSKSIFEKDRRELLAIPETIASYFYEAVNKVSPKVSQFLLDTVQSPTVIAARQRIAKEATKVSIMFEQLVEKIKNLWYTRILGY